MVTLPDSFRRIRIVAYRIALSAAICLPWVTAARAEPSHAISMQGAPALPPDFKTLRYANPDAPKGGRFVQGVLGTFDSLNPFVVKGLAAIGLRGYVYESLMARGYDEPFTLYGLLAQSVETDDARSFVTFTLNPRARFSDGKPVTVEDVIFSWQLLRDKGRPNYRTYYAKVVKAEALDGGRVRFDLTGSDDRELPLILGLMPVLAKHATDPATFEDTTLTGLLGSGPYTFTAVNAGRSITLTRDKNYWGNDLPIYRGFWNFDEVRFDYYRDDNAHFEAFKKGLYDVRTEPDPGRWVTGYDVPAVRDGRIVQEAFGNGLPKGMLAFVFNTRRPVFADPKVREAISLLFDFEWLNRNYFFGRYKRTGSFYEGSELSALGRPADARERALLAPFPGAVRPDVLGGQFAPTASDGTGRDRERLKRALDLFKEAGFTFTGAELRGRDGKPFNFEILVTTREQQRLALAFGRDLKRAGIRTTIRTVDAVQYDRRRINFDFDMIEYRWDASLSPGNEQYFYWGSGSADQNGTRNYMGIKSPAADAMIAEMLKARTREEFVSAVRALDRILISGYFVVPLYHLPDQWVARWTRIAHPPATSLFGYLPETWWYAPETRSETPAVRPSRDPR